MLTCGVAFLSSKVLTGRSARDGMLKAPNGVMVRLSSGTITSHQSEFVLALGGRRTVFDTSGGKKSIRQRTLRATYARVGQGS